ncbi:hypothetical protein BXZ70DRAFT_907701 [Cristinia sonorae]|uniref:Uncharacterized protein n=1 Tax=Cristinia sonorae TaxID=1940300 RepID=A0A8K0UNI4_9AGAR|nr:hypothetical protein BXZ70DRAFT_907701 [Cristinia sonorae]
MSRRECKRAEGNSKKPSRPSDSKHSFGQRTSRAASNKPQGSGTSGLSKIAIKWRMDTNEGEGAEECCCGAIALGKFQFTDATSKASSGQLLVVLGRSSYPLVCRVAAMGYIVTGHTHRRGDVASTVYPSVALKYITDPLYQPYISLVSILELGLKLRGSRQHLSWVVAFKAVTRRRHLRIGR